MSSRTDDEGAAKITLARKHRTMSIMPTDTKTTPGQRWQLLMRKFSDSHKEQCKSTSMEMPRLPRSTKEFPTGSEYEGHWNVLGMSGFGTYTFPYEGVMYVGQFEDGMFHGTGELRYECGVIIRGKWDKGKITERQLIFSDGLEYDEENWKYCKMPDRRFAIEYEDEIKPAGESYLTADQPTIDVPPGHFDVGDGFYDPDTKMVFKYDDFSGLVRSPGIAEHKWIMENCRTAPDDPVGPFNYIYENWLEPSLELEFPPPPPARMTNLDYDDDDEISSKRKVPTSILKPKEDTANGGENAANAGKSCKIQDVSDHDDKAARESDTSYELKSFLFDKNKAFLYYTDLVQRQESRSWGKEGFMYNPTREDRQSMIRLGVSTLERPSMSKQRLSVLASGRPGLRLEDTKRRQSGLRTDAISTVAFKPGSAQPSVASNTASFFVPPSRRNEGLSVQSFVSTASSKLSVKDSNVASKASVGSDTADSFKPGKPASKSKESGTVTSVSFRKYI